MSKKIDMYSLTSIDAFLEDKKVPADRKSEFLIPKNTTGLDAEMEEVNSTDFDKPFYKLIRKSDRTYISISLVVISKIRDIMKEKDLIGISFMYTENDPEVGIFGGWNPKAVLKK